MIVHCQSGDNDLGGQETDVGSRYTWHFVTNLFGGTYFWCDLDLGDRRLSFTAFDQEKRGRFASEFYVGDGGVYKEFGCSGNPIVAWRPKG
ncbi:unnamed protein product [Linum tenue]|uniref:S-protein homolog n=1 Tax=Linum tenue TaxID=586396 RepID=A0AAV0IB23_9ROSI|nr:unnamed protein product [Linum tenue]